MQDLGFTLKINDLFSQGLQKAITNAERLEKILDRISAKSIPNVGNGSGVGLSGAGRGRSLGRNNMGYNSRWDPEQAERRNRRNAQFDDRFNNYLSEGKRLDRRNAKSSRGMMGGLGMLGLVGGVAFATSAIMDFGRATLQSLKDYEYFHVSMTALMKGNQNAAAALENQLVSLAKESPFSLSDVQQGAKSLIAYGFKPTEVISELKLMGNVAAATKVPLSDMTLVLGTLRAQSRAYKKDINQFTQRGINILPSLKKMFNTDGEGLNDLIKEGKVGFKEVNQVLKEMTSKGGLYFNQMAESAKTTGGRLEKLSDTLEQFRVALGKSSSGLINSFISMSQSIADNMVRIAKASNEFDRIEKKSPLAGFGWRDIKNLFKGGNTESTSAFELVNQLEQRFDKLAGKSVGGPNEIVPNGSHMEGKKSVIDYAVKTNPNEYAPEKANFLKYIKSVFTSNSNQFKKGEITPELYNLTKQALKEYEFKVKGLDDFNKSGKDDDEEKNKIKEELDTGIKTSTGRQDITININGPLAEQTFNVEKGDEDSEAFYQKLKKGMSRVYLEVVNDANSIAKNR